MNRKYIWLKLFAFSLLLLSAPDLASAQNRDRDRNNDDYYGNDRNDRNNRNNRNDEYDRNNRNRNNGGYNNNNNRALEDAIRRLERNSNNFANTIDRALDRSRYDGSRREDRINDVAQNFERAADNLKNNFDGGRNLNRSADEARDLLQNASQIDRFLSRNNNNLDNSVESRWAQIETDLYYIAEAYNINYNGGSYRNNRNNRNNNDNRNNRNNRNTRNNGRWGNIQIPGLPW